jgi:hypothetical protein
VKRAVKEKVLQKNDPFPKAGTSYLNLKQIVRE